MKRRLSEWPDELKKPIVVDDLRPGMFSDPARSHEEAVEEWVSREIMRRMIILAQFFGHPTLPDTNEEWARLFRKLCEHCNIPAFQRVGTRPPGTGPGKFWTDVKHCELFADVQSLVARSNMTEHAACRHIAKNPSLFAGRYPTTNGSTLHRQFVTAKRKALSDSTFQMFYFGEGAGLIRPIPDRSRLVELAIERYAATRKLSKRNPRKINRP
jgi:hypothetical protein